MRAETFLKMYRVLEGLLEEKFLNARRPGASVVMEYLESPESESVRAKLNLCREMRNLLTHNADEDGEPVAEPSRETLQTLYDVIDFVQRPRTALSAATPIDRVLTARADDYAMDVIRRMHEHGYSVAPVVSGRGMAGVFDSHCLLAHIAGGGFINEETRIRHFGRLLRMDSRSASRYMFMAQGATAAQARAAFLRQEGPNSRLLAIFITENGGADAPLMGMLTPWDVLDDD